MHIYVNINIKMMKLKQYINCATKNLNYILKDFRLSLSFELEVMQSIIDLFDNIIFAPFIK